MNSNFFTVMTNQSSYDSNPNERARANRLPKSHPVRITGGESVYVSPCRTYHAHGQWSNDLGKQQMITPPSAHVKRAPATSYIFFPHDSMGPHLRLHISHLYLVRDDCTVYDSQLSFIANESCESYTVQSSRTNYKWEM